ncbi:hypothetical protein [Dactylosporangium sp. CS-033363]|uniref:hypothetical protein n=1 Tax=Dactylosporangium sp. CS-033363 TaxID=3239935 RepID=UPI003D93E322
MTGNDAYYGGVDPRHAGGPVSRATFERDLVNMILFDDRILLSDSIFFNNPTVLEHVRAARDAPSLFEHAIMRGIVTPTVREPVDSFADIARYVRRYELLGALPPGEVEELAARYSVAPGQFVLWPERMGDRYLHLLTTQLSDPVLPPRYAGSLIDDETWRATEWLRREVIAEAVDVERGRTGSGVRRGEIVKVVARIMGVLPYDPSALDTHAVFAAIAEHDPRREAVRNFFDWIDDLWHFNQASAFSVKPQLSAANPGSLALVPSPGLSSDPQPGAATWQFTAEERIPRFDVLMALGPNRLFELRDYGHEWAAASRALVNLPPDTPPTVVDTMRQRAERSLHEYARRINRATRAAAPKELLIVEGAVNVASAPVVTAIGELTAWRMSLVPLHSFLSIGAFGWWAFKFFANSTRKDTVQITRRPAGIVEFPTSPRA